MNIQQVPEREAECDPSADTDSASQPFEVRDIFSSFINYSI